MEWVKLSVHYADDLAIAEADDAGEVMFTRALAYCGRAKTGGFIPDSKLQELTRRPSRAKAIVRQLTRDTSLGDAGPLEVVQGGYQVRNWSHYQEQFDALTARRKSDRDRQAKKRVQDRAAQVGSREQSRDTSRDVTPPEKRREEVHAAAAASDDQATPSSDLPPAVAILRSSLDAHKLTVRWDRLTRDELAEIEALVATHGDAVLIKAALAAYQPNKPPVYAKAWLGGWRALPAPGQLGLVRQPCEIHGTKLTPAGVCISCAADMHVKESS